MKLNIRHLPLPSHFVQVGGHLLSNTSPAIHRTPPFNFIITFLKIAFRVRLYGMTRVDENAFSWSVKSSVSIGSLVKSGMARINSSLSTWERSFVVSSVAIFQTTSPRQQKIKPAPCPIITYGFREPKVNQGCLRGNL